MLKREWFITKRQHAYWTELEEHCREERDENGIDLSLIRENLKLSPHDRIQRMARFARILRALYSGDPMRVEGAMLSRKMMVALDDADDAERAGDEERKALALWAIDKMLPRPFDERQGCGIKRESAIATLRATEFVRQETA